MKKIIKITFVVSFAIVSIKLPAAQHHQVENKSGITNSNNVVNQGIPLSKPNIVLFLVDDMATADIKYMPTLSQLANAGVQFTNFVTPTPMCTQSRTSILRGQYSHNTGQLYNAGFDTFYQMGLEKETIAVWLQRAGYSTALFGKYINGYPSGRFVKSNYIPPGWTEWFGGMPNASYDFSLNENGVFVKYHEPGPHINDELARLASNFIDRHYKEPMFLYIATPSPHSPAIPAHRHEALYNTTPFPQDPSFNEDDVSDKPTYIKKKSKMSADSPLRLNYFRNRIRSLRSVEDLITSVTATLEKYGIRENTYFVFLSDNGFHYGDHRILSGKHTPYDESNIVPAWIWGPGIPSNVKRDHLVANSDIAQTFAELAGATIPSFVDGRSLVPLLGEQSIPISDWRQAIPIAWEQSLYFPWQNVNNPWPPSYFGLLTNSDKYVYYTTLEQELYLHDSDPYEMESQHANPLMAKKLKGMLDWAQKFSLCHGASCRQLDIKPTLN